MAEQIYWNESRYNEKVAVQPTLRRCLNSYCQQLVRFNEASHRIKSRKTKYLSLDSPLVDLEIDGIWMEACENDIDI